MIFGTLIFSTFKEALEKKIILVIFIVIALIVFLMLAFLNLDSVVGMNELLKMQGEEGYKQGIIEFENVLISQPTFLVVFSLLIVLSSSFIPSMLEKGSVDVLLSKPISRVNIIIGKYISVVLFAFLIIAFLISLIWLMISIKSGIWHFSYLQSIIWFTLIFAVLYSLVLLTGVLTQSTVLSIIINLLLLFPVTGLLAVRESLMLGFLSSDIAKGVINFFYYIFPKPWDLREMCVILISGGTIESWQPLITSVLFMLAMLSISIYYFSKKDY
jgi:ABC-2 type transport system permease protein